MKCVTAMQNVLVGAEDNEVVATAAANKDLREKRSLEESKEDQQDDRSNRRKINAEASDDDEDEPFEEETSILAMKRKILRRDLDTDEPQKSLLEELSCVICHELLYDAVSLPCGHSHCQHCWIWWEAKSTNVSHCPTCRATLPEDTSVLPNHPLNVALAALFPHQTADRKQAHTAGDDNGRHDFGNAVIVPVQEHEWETKFGIRVRRSIVLDCNDQCMVYGLAIRDVSWETNDMLHITVCRVHLEQDEASEGMPVFIDDENSDDDWLIVPHDETEIGIFDSTGPLQRVTMGLVTLEMNKTHSIRHESTGCELQIQRDSISFASVPRKENDRGISLIDEGQCASSDDAQHEDDEEDDGSFLVDESNCAICHDGGELLVCDGGDHDGGCARSFHLKCIGRTTIPEGDWICQECANKANAETPVGIEGLEYPVSEDEEDDDVAPEPQFSGSDDDDDTGLRAKSMYKQKRKAILVDSDDDDSD